MQSAPTTLLYTTEEAAQILRCKPRTIRNAILRGDIPEAMKFGNQWRIPAKVIEKYLRGDLTNDSTKPNR